MSQVTYDSEKIEKKRVRFTAAATEKLLAGYMFCYNSDYGTASAEDQARAVYVEKPASGKLHNFAGWLSAEQAGKSVVSGDTYMLDIIVPTARGQRIPVHTDQSCTIDVTELSLVAGQWYAGSSAEGVVVARAAQTVDRSGTAGTVLANCFGVGLMPQPAVAASARSRTAVQLPTAAIWDHFDLDDMRANPFKGSLLEADFTHAGEAPDVKFVDATYAASAAGKTLTEHLKAGVTAIGELVLFATTDNQAVEGQWLCPITVSGGNKWAFECRIKQSVLTDSKAGYFVGLALANACAGDIIVDGGTLQTEGSLGFQVKEGDGDKVDVVYDETGQTQNEHAADWATQVANTYNTFGLYFNGSTIQMYLDGVAEGTAISAADIAAADFPTAKVFVPTVALKNAHADDFTVTMDWIRVAQGA